MAWQLVPKTAGYSRGHEMSAGTSPLIVLHLTHLAAASRRLTGKLSFRSCPKISEGLGRTRAETQQGQVEAVMLERETASPEIAGDGKDGFSCV